MSRNIRALTNSGARSNFAELFPANCAAVTVLREAPPASGCGANSAGSCSMALSDRVTTGLERNGATSSMSKGSAFDDGLRRRSGEEEGFPSSSLCARAPAPVVVGRAAPSAVLDRCWLAIVGVCVGCAWESNWRGRGVLLERGPRKGPGTRSRVKPTLCTGSRRWTSEYSTLALKSRWDFGCFDG